MVYTHNVCRVHVKYSTSYTCIHNVYGNDVIIGRMYITSLGPRPKTNPSVDRFQGNTGSDIRAG